MSKNITFYPKLSNINFTINQAKTEIAKPVNAIVIVSLHCVWSDFREPNNNLYAHIITKITAIVQASQRKISIIHFNAPAISSL